MSLNWENRWDSYYSRFRRPFARVNVDFFFIPYTESEETGQLPGVKPSYMMALNSSPTTVQSLIDIVQRRSEHSFHPFYSANGLDKKYDCDEVYPNIYIGDGTTAKRKEYLKKLGITHVLNTAEGKGFSLVDTNRAFYEGVGIQYLGFQLLDHPSSNISMYFNEAADFIHNAIISGGKVYVHCLMGVSRSSTCVIAYLMKKKGMSAADAIRTIKQKREIHPNVGFLQQLADLDNTLKREKDLCGIWSPY